jgi:hypothetical protein
MSFSQENNLKKVEFKAKVYFIPNDWNIKNYEKDDEYEFSIETPDNELFFNIEDCRKNIIQDVNAKNIAVTRFNTNFINTPRSSWEFHPEACGSIDLLNNNNMELIFNQLNMTNLIHPKQF